MPKENRKPSFSYRDRDDSTVDRRSKQTSSRYDSILTDEVGWAALDKGENQIRILGWINNDWKNVDELVEIWDDYWGIDVVIHRNVGADKGTYLCLAKNNKAEPCPICDAWKEEGIEALKPSDRVLTWMVDRNDEKAGPVLWNMPLGTSKDISKASQLRGKSSDAGKKLKIDDWEEGHDVFIERTGEKERTRWSVLEVDRASTPIHDKESTQDKWLAYIFEFPPLPEMLKFYDAEYLEKVLAGKISKREDDDGDEEEDGEEKDSRRERSRPSRRGRDKDEEEGEDDGEEKSARPSRRGRNRDEDEDEKEEGFSRPSRRGRAEPEESDEEDEGEEDTPSRSERSSGRSRGGGKGKEKEPERSSRRGRNRDEEEEEPDDETPSRPHGGRGKNERYKPKDEDNSDEEDGEADEADARKRLRNVGNRGRGK